jgi:assimilatory nitrate reductase catalytic subunit
MNAQDMARRLLKEGDLVHVTSRRGSIVVPLQASAEVGMSQAFMAMHWGDDYLSGISSTGGRLAGVNALTTSAFCPSSKQPELKHAAVKILKAELPWSLLAMAWFTAESDALAARDALRGLMSAFSFTSCVPFSNNTPLGEPSKSGVLFRAAGYDTATPEVLAILERVLGLSGPDVLRYADIKKGQHRAVRLARTGGKAELTGFVLAGDTSAQAWMRTLLQEELPAEAYGRLLLVPGSKAPVAVQSRGKPVCACFNVTDLAIADTLSAINSGAPVHGVSAGYLSTDDQRFAALQASLKCGTNCGSCVPELKRLVRSSRVVPPSAGVSAQRVVPVRPVN